MHSETIATLKDVEKAIRALPDMNHEEMKAAQSASMAAALLNEAQLKRTKQAAVEKRKAAKTE
jgi:hypothetical protein